MTDHVAFVTGLRMEHQAFHSLCNLLESEQACLVRSDVEGLFELTRLKSEQVDRLTELAQRRMDHLRSLGLDTGQAGIDTWMTLHAGVERAELTQLWQELIRLAAHARSLNDINGKLITTRLSHNQAALSVLQSSARAHNIYGPDGHAEIVAGQRELGRA